MDIETLTDESGLMVRTMQVRATDTDKREFTGVGVPYGETYQMGDGMSERFEAGAVTEADTAKIFWQHREVIGRVTDSRETADGFEITGKISDTSRGRDAWALLRDSAVDSLSIGFRPLEHRVETDAEGNETIIHTKVEAREFSVVSFPAYTTAKISATRSAPATPKGTTTMDTDTLTRDDLAPINDALEVVNRRLDKAIETPGGEDSTASQYRSLGDFLKAIAAGDSDAAEFHRAYTGGTTADAVMKDSFIGEYIHLVDRRRRTINQFSRNTLPADGMSVDYAQLKSNTVKVSKQTAEGADLPKGKVQLKDANAPVATYGGAASLSLQAVKRASVPTLNTTLKALALAYAAETDAAAAKAFREVITANAAAAGDHLEVPASATANDWLDTVVDAALMYEDRGFLLEGLSVSADRFKELMHLKDGDNRLMTVYGDGVNQVGSMNLAQLQGNIANIPVNILRDSPTGTASFYDSTAIETLESPGAPAQLQDENIINLTKDYSLYGFAAFITPFPSAIVPVTAAAV